MTKLLTGGSLLNYFLEGGKNSGLHSAQVAEDMAYLEENNILIVTWLQGISWLVIIAYVK